MKLTRTLLLGALLSVAASCVCVASESAEACSSTSSVSRTRRTMYYLVFGSYSSLAAAKQAIFDGPDMIVGCCVYRTVAKGKTVYRIVIYETSSLVKMQKHKCEWDGYMTQRTTWIWTCKGRATCVYRDPGLGG